MRTVFALTGLALAACSPAPSTLADTHAATGPQLISEADAIAFLNKVPTALIAGDAEGAVALFSDNAVLVDVSTNALVTTKEGNLAATKAFTSAGITGYAINAQTAQVLDADTFVVTSIVTGTMAADGASSQMTIRVTDVVQRQADGSWLIVNEHASQAPEPITEPLPIIGTIPPQ